MNVNDKNFEEEIIKSKIPVLVEFWASWCVPCQMMDLVLKELETEYNSKIKVGAQSKKDLFEMIESVLT